MDREEINQGSDNNTKEGTTFPVANPSKLSKREIIAKAFSYHSKGYLIEAVKYYQKFIDQGYHDPRVYSNYGSILQNKGNLDQAIKLLNKSIKLFPSSPEAYSNLGNLYRDLGNFSQAELLLNTAINLNSSFFQAYYNIGNLYRDIGRFKEAEKSMRKAIELNSNFAEAYNNLGIILNELNQSDEAELMTVKAIELNPDFAEAHCNLGKRYRELGKLNEAKKFIDKAIRLNPNLAEAYSNLGGILNELGRSKEAEMAMRRALELNPNLAETYANLGGVLRDLGKLEELILISASSLELDSLSNGDKLQASLKMALANLMLENFSETYFNINQTIEYINQGGIEMIKNKQNQKNSIVFFKLISALYPKLKNNLSYVCKEKIPHIGESHCLSFSHQSVKFGSNIKKIQPVLVVGAKAWHFANQKSNQWKSSLLEQIRNHTYSDEVFISFGEIDCREEEGILYFSQKYQKDVSVVCKNTINGYLDFMEQSLSKFYSKRFYFGIPAPTAKGINISLDIQRKDLIKTYNYLLKKEVLSRGSYFLDVFKLTVDEDGFNNSIYMCDEVHLDPDCLNLLFMNHLYIP